MAHDEHDLAHLAELERRVTAALDRIGRGLGRLADRAAAAAGLEAALAEAADWRARAAAGAEALAAAEAELTLLRHELARRDQDLAAQDAPRVDGAGDHAAALAAERDRAAALAADLAAERDRSADLAAQLQALERALAAEQSARTAAEEELAALRADVDLAATALAQAEARAAEAADLRARAERLTAQLDAQGLDLTRMRKNVIVLRDHVRALREAAQAEVDPQAVNRALAAEVEALQALRAGETAALGQLLSELEPLVAEGRDG
ncbi:MAG: hypothetical protein IE927_06415 [Rhodobacterales bacterium]|nr:hypothetical protein [Rhodobacterales bacterium]